MAPASPLKIAVLGGDGIGPEVMAEGLRALNAVADAFGHSLSFEEGLIGGCAIDATGSALPDATLRICQNADAVLLGAVGGPKWDNPDAKVRPEQGLLGLRKALGVFANLRPVRAHPLLLAGSPLKPERLKGVDFIVVRELTGGIYFGDKKRETLPGGGERATDVCSYTTEEIERVTRVAAELARGRRGKLTSVDKANVIETSRLWRRTVTRVMKEEFPDVKVDHVLVDACAMFLLSRPADFDVIVTENMFGDILTDEASMLAGSMGALPSASIGAGGGHNAVAGHDAQADGSGNGGGAPEARRTRGLYEPIHGSAPDIAGKGIANPMGTILSVAMMLRYSFGMQREAKAVEAAVDAALDAGVLTTDIAPKGTAPASTEAFGKAVAEQITKARRAPAPARA